MASVAPAVGGHVLGELILGAMLLLPHISIWETNRPLGSGGPFFYFRDAALHTETGLLELRTHFWCFLSNFQIFTIAISKLLS